MSKQETSPASGTTSSEKKQQSSNTPGVSMTINDSQLLDNESPVSQGIKTPSLSKVHQDEQAKTDNTRVTSSSTPILYKPLFTTKDEHIVSYILRHSDFNSAQIKFLMMQRKLRTFPQVANMTQEDWNKYTLNNNINLTSTDYIQIVVFQTWWNSNKLNCEIEDV